MEGESKAMGRCWSLPHGFTLQLSQGHAGSIPACPSSLSHLTLNLAVAI